MYIKKLTIKNFRVFDEDGITLQFNKGVNAIIGENNSGKSAVMDAIRIAFSTVTYKKDIFFTRADFHVFEDGNAADFALFDIYLEEVPTRLVELWDPESAGGHGGEFHIRFERVIATNGIEKVRAIHWGIGTEGTPLSSDTFDAMDVMFLGALRDSESEMKPARNSKLAQLLRSLVPDEDTRAELVDILNSANNTLLKKEELKKTRETINDNLARIEQDFLSQHVDIGLIEPRFDSIASSLRAWIKPKWLLVSISDGEYSRAQQYAKEHADNRKIQQNENGIYFETSILENVEDMAPELVTRINEIASSSFELYQNGLGYNNLLFISAVLGDMAIERGGVYQHLLLIEEPEAHLHPQLQELVHTFLADTNQGDANIQIIFTSHSPTLVSKVGIGNINLIYENAHRKYCLPFSEANLTDANKEYLQKYLDVTKSQMFFAKGIIFVEGISEAILLPEIAKILDRPLEKYSVEVVNVDSVAFSPFVNLFSSHSVQSCFSKVAIVTDDDRCTKKSETNYINKDFDYDDVNSDISDKLLNGTPSERCNELETSCRAVGINVFKATKTLEYALCCDENNIEYFIEAIKSEYSQLGPALEQKVNSLHDMNEKAACVWLFIQVRDKCKGAIAQYISQTIKKQCEMRKRGETIEKEFVIPDYLKEAVFCVTER